MLPKDLQDIFDEHEGDFDLYIVKADHSGDKFIIDFVVNPLTIENERLAYQKWTIIASNLRKDRISFAPASFIEIKNDHPLLWEFTDTWCQLYFTGQCQNFEKLFYDLCRTNYEIFGELQSFNISLFKASNYFKPFQYSNGLLTQGSKKLMEKYAACLMENELDFTFLGETPPGYRYSHEFNLENLKILFMGDTYLIAEDFSFVKQPEENH